MPDEPRSGPVASFFAAALASREPLATSATGIEERDATQERLHRKEERDERERKRASSTNDGGASDDAAFEKQSIRSLAAPHPEATAAAQLTDEPVLTPRS